MYKILTISADYPENIWFQYDRDSSPNHLIFKRGIYFADITVKPIFKLNTKKNIETVLKYDWLWSDGPNFINQRLANYFKLNFNDDIQLISADVWINDIQISEYMIPNILNAVSCIDMNKSEYDLLFDDMPDGPKNFKKYKFIDNSLGEHKVCRSKEQLTTIVVTCDFAAACNKFNIKGVDFV